MDNFILIIHKNTLYSLHNQGFYQSNFFLENPLGLPRGAPRIKSPTFSKSGGFYPHKKYPINARFVTYNQKVNIEKMPAIYLSQNDKLKADPYMLKYLLHPQRLKKD